jgi:hypothetical protein
VNTTPRPPHETPDTYRHPNSEQPDRPARPDFAQFPRPPETMRRFLAGCIATVLLVGVYLYAPMFAPIRGETPLDALPARAPAVAVAALTATSSLPTAITPDQARDYVHAMAKWLISLREGYDLYGIMRRTGYPVNMDSWNRYNEAATIWVIACGEFRSARRTGLYDEVLPETQRHVLSMCDLTEPASSAMYRALVDESRDQYEEAVRLMGEAGSALRSAERAYKVGR